MLKVLVLSTPVAWSCCGLLLLSGDIVGFSCCRSRRCAWIVILIVVESSFVVYVGVVAPAMSMSGGFTGFLDAGVGVAVCDAKGVVVAASSGVVLRLMFLAGD